MFSPAIRNQRRSALSSGLKIGLSLLPGILAPLMALNFWWAMKIFAANAALAHDTYFSLANKGFYRFTGVRMISGSQPVIEFKDILIAIGLIFGVASLILAGAAWTLDRKQRRKR